MASSFSESGEWFDAADGGEEYMLEDDEPTPVEEKNESEGGLSSGVSSSSVDESSEVEEEGGEKVPDEEVLEEAKKEVVVDLVEQAKHVARRTELPSGPVGDDGSLFAVLKKNVGKVSRSRQVAHMRLS